MGPAGHTLPPSLSQHLWERLRRAQAREGATGGAQRLTCCSVNAVRRGPATGGDGEREHADVPRDSRLEPAEGVSQGGEVQPRPQTGLTSSSDIQV